jgi:hypothetical protein
LPAVELVESVDEHHLRQNYMQHRDWATCRAGAHLDCDKP